MSDRYVEHLLTQQADAIKGKTPRKKKSTWKRPETIPDGRVLAFDQTFSKTGWCFVIVKDGKIGVIGKGFIQEPPIPDKPAFEDILQRSEWMYDRICDVIYEVQQHTYDIDICHEAPVLHAHRVESSLLGGFAVRLAARRVMGKTPIIVENRHMLGLLVPPDERYNQKGKSHITRALLPYVDTAKGWNEHTRDSLALALTFLCRQESPDAS